MIWYFEDYRRYRREREVLEALASSADWLIPIGWRVDGELHMIWDADIVAPAGVRPISLRYPNHFPHSPPMVLPRGVKERWSGHQYGSGGELCLECLVSRVRAYLHQPDRARRAARAAA